MAQRLEGAHVYDDVFPLVLQPRNEPLPPMLAEDEVRVDRFQPYSRAPQYTTKDAAHMRTFEIQLWSIEEEDRQNLN